MKKIIRLLRVAISCGWAEHRNPNPHEVNEDLEYRLSTNDISVIGLKQLLGIFSALICISLPANAKTVYITDIAKFSLRSEENNTSKILKMMTSGTPLTVLSENKETGYLKVLYGGELEGFIMSRFTLNKPVSLWHLNKTKIKLKKLQKKYDAIKTKFNQSTKGNTETLSSNQLLTQERDQLSKDLNDLQITAANAVQLKHQKTQLEKRTISVEKELRQVKYKNRILKDSTNQRWFLYGGVLSLMSIILGFILPKLGWRRKVGNWETF